MRGWLASGRAAARLATERADLWLPAALPHLLFAGWLPFLLTVVRLPSSGDLAFYGAGLVASGDWPWNVVLLAVLAAGGVLLAIAVASLGESALVRAVAGTGGTGGTGRRRRHATPRLFVVTLIAALPVAIAATALATAIVSVAPGEFQSPDIGGGVFARIIGGVAPLLAALGLAVLLAQAYAAAAGRRAIEPVAEPLPVALAAAWHDLARAPLRLAGVAVVSMAATLAYLAAVFGLLRVLWAPIAVRLATGQLAEAAGVLLLVGFVAIWICCLLGGGALHAWASSWWSFELARARGGAPEPPATKEGILPA